MNLNKTELKAFRDDFAQAVKALEAKYRVKMSFGNISYNQTEFQTKLTVANVSETGELVVDPTALKFKNIKAAWAINQVNMGTGFHIPNEVIGSHVVLKSNKTGKIVDFDSKKFKFPFIVEIDGTKFKISADAIKSFL